MNAIRRLPGRALRALRPLVPGRGFVAAPPTADERRRAYDRDGFVAGGPLFDRRQLGHLRAEFDRTFAAGTGTATGIEYERVEVGPDREFFNVKNLHRSRPAFEEAVRHPRLVELLVELTGCESLRVFHDQVQYKPPRIGGRNAWHRDMPSFPLVRPCTALTAWIPLDDATTHTGCMRMVPGSHLWGDASDLAVEGDGWGLPGVNDLRTYRGHPVLVVERPMRAGQVHFHHEMVWHSSGRNATRHKRRALVVQYIAADDRYCKGRWSEFAGLAQGDRMDPVAPLVVRRRGAG